MTIGKVIRDEQCEITLSLYLEDSLYFQQLLTNADESPTFESQKYEELPIKVTFDRNGIYVLEFTLTDSMFDPQSILAAYLTEIEEDIVIQQLLTMPFRLVLEGDSGRIKTEYQINLLLKRDTDAPDLDPVDPVTVITEEIVPTNSTQTEEQDGEPIISIDNSTTSGDSSLREKEIADEPIP